MSDDTQRGDEVTREREADAQRRLNSELKLLLGKRLISIKLDGVVWLSFAEDKVPSQDVSQTLGLETPFTIGPPNRREMVIPWRYGPSIARLAEVWRDTVTSAATEPSIYDLRVTFSSGTQLVVPREYRTSTEPSGMASWQYYPNASDPAHIWFID